MAFSIFVHTEYAWEVMDEHEVSLVTGWDLSLPRRQSPGSYRRKCNIGSNLGCGSWGSNIFCCDEVGGVIDNLIIMPVANPVRNGQKEIGKIENESTNTSAGQRSLQYKRSRKALVTVGRCKSLDGGFAR